MAELKPGDVVEYWHTRGGDPVPNGAVGVVTDIDAQGDVVVNWISVPIHLGKHLRTHPYNLRKLGELEVERG